MKRVYKQIGVIGAATMVAVLSGCSNTTAQTNSVSTTALNAAEIEQRAAELNTRESELMQREADLQGRASATAAIGSDTLLPPSAKPGECYARVWVPAQYRQYSKEVLTKEASERVEIVPASYSWGTEEVLVSQASSRIKQIPAVYGTETETIQISEAERIWKTGLNSKSSPASKELLTTVSNAGIDLSSATPGMCFHEHYRPAQYTQESQQVTISDASERVEIVPAEYRTVEKQVLVSEASSRLVEVPAVYETVSETVVDVPEHTIWKKGTGPVQRINEATGEIMCLVTIPATYKTLSRRVMKSPPTTKTVEIPAVYKTVAVKELASAASERRVAIPAEHDTVSITKLVTNASFVWHEIHDRTEPSSTRTGQKICLTETPAKYKTVTRRVVTTPASTRTIEIPAVYKTIKVKKMASPAVENRIAIPAEYKTVSLKELTKEGFMDWRSILCETNMTAGRIGDIQRALQEAGYNPGAIDGIIGADTMRAVNAFQKDKNLPVDQYLNIATVEALGVSSR
jgi:hypothetical protein